MNVLIVYASQFGTTEHLAYAMARAIEPEHVVRVAREDETRDLTGEGVDLLLVGAPTQMHGLHLLVRPFLAGLRTHGFRGVPATAFDTRDDGPKSRTGSEAEVIAVRLVASGCRLVVPPESFVVVDVKGPLASGEEARATEWIRDVVAATAATAVPKDSH